MTPTVQLTDSVIRESAPNVAMNQNKLYDFNDSTLASGTYYVTNETLNIPNGAYRYGIASVEKTSTTAVYMRQRYTPHKRAEEYIRECWDGVFTSWVKFTGETLT